MPWWCSSQSICTSFIMNGQFYQCSKWNIHRSDLSKAMLIHPMYINIFPPKKLRHKKDRGANKQQMTPPRSRASTLSIVSFDHGIRVTHACTHLHITDAFLLPCIIHTPIYHQFLSITSLLYMDLFYEWSYYSHVNKSLLGLNDKVALMEAFEVVNWGCEDERGAYSLIYHFRKPNQNQSLSVMISASFSSHFSFPFFVPHSLFLKRYCCQPL